jgi:tripartite-type tricarboxylate transporter receptor subunit TctC
MQHRHVQRLSRRTLLGAALGMPFVHGAVAQTYPTRSPRMIVPFPAGGPTDVLTRIAAERASTALGQQVIVENKGGAGGNIAGDQAARAEADGYTMLVAGQAILAINKALYKKLSYDPAADFAFIGMLGVIANVLLVNPNTVPVKSVAELIALAKKKPGDIAYASNGPGSLTHLTTAILAKEAGISLLHVPYQGAAPLMTDLIAGRVGMTFTAASAALPLVQSGQLRALAVTTGRRSRFTPDTPTLVESGFPMLDAPTWFGVVARSATPQPILARLRSTFGEITGREEYAKALESKFMEVMPLAPDAADVFLAKERNLWAEAVKVAGVAID